MKNALGLAVYFVAALSACSSAPEDGDSSTVEVNHESSVGVSWEEYRDAARAAGGADYYVAEWDLFFSTEARLKQHYEQIATEQSPKLAVFQQLSSGFEPTYVGLDAVDIAYCVSNSFTNKSTVVADIAAATAAWQDVMNVIFRYDAAQDASCDQNNANVDFAVVPTSVSGLAGCAANKLLWPEIDCPIGNGGTRARGILSVNYGALPLFPGTTGAGLFRHELGHMVGFRHEHPWAPNGGGCPETPTVQSEDATGRRLTAYDQLSVMHYASCGGILGSDPTISVLDGEGGRQVYGMPIAWYVPFTDNPT